MGIQVRQNTPRLFLDLAGCSASTAFDASHCGVDNWSLDRSLPLNTSLGYGALSNIERTFRGYAAAGLAGIMIEDQVSPKRCGHTRGKGQGASRTLIVFFCMGEIWPPNASSICRIRASRIFY